jgi:signal transduction histidine kinase
MPEDILKNLFKNSSQVRRIGTTGEQSTGLGLPMVKEMLDLMGGKIQVDSVENIGTTITIYFPT